MGDKTGISWTSATWNPLRGCSRVSPGCQFCYAERVAARFSGPGQPYEGLATMVNGHPRWTGKLSFPEKMLEQPLRWKKPRRIFVNSMSDLFHEDVPDSFIDQVFAVMASCPQHVFQVLTKRPERMREYMSDPPTPHRVAQAIDRSVSERARLTVPEEIRPLIDYPAYFVSNLGHVYTSSGTMECRQCGAALTGSDPRRTFCSSACRARDHYERKALGKERAAAEPRSSRMAPDPGEQGHLRVTLRRDGVAVRELVHRLVLATFDRLPIGDEQGRHMDGNPANNFIGNLRWGTQSQNWDERRRHGDFRSYAKLSHDEAAAIRESSGSAAQVAARFGISDTQVRNIRSGLQWCTGAPIPWPPPGLWLGVSVEDQQRADERIPLLLQTPAAVRFLSVEPLLGPVDLAGYRDHLDWVIVGGESGGPSDRALVQRCGNCGGGAPASSCSYCHGQPWKPKPAALGWVRNLGIQCETAGVAFYFKQWGGPTPATGGRELDGRVWDEFPAAVPV